MRRGSVSHNDDDGDDKEGRDQRKRTIECFGAGSCGGHLERRHDMNPWVHLLPRPASFCENQSLTVGRSAEQARLLERLGPLHPGRHLTRFLEGIHRSRVLMAIIAGDHPFLLFAHGCYWGGLSSPPSHSRTLDSIGSVDMVDV
jgi:hypothetical protein